MKEKYRDVTFLSLGDNSLLTITCDSCGGIGDKEHDAVKADPYIVGYYTAFVAMAETIAIGARPITIINTLSVEMKDTGKKIINGIKKAVIESGLQEEVMITGSTEENFPVTVTGLGLTVIGQINKERFKLPKVKENSIAVVIGKPKVGDEVLNDKGEILTLKTLLKIKSMHCIQDILPVGSKGILYEANEMARTSDLRFYANDSINIDINTSAGPATCAIVALEEEYLKQLEEIISIPFCKIGVFNIDECV